VKPVFWPELSSEVKSFPLKKWNMQPEKKGEKRNRKGVKSLTSSTEKRTSVRLCSTITGKRSNNKKDLSGARTKG